MQKKQLRPYDPKDSYYVQERVLPIGVYPVPLYLENLAPVEGFDGLVVRYYRNIFYEEECLSAAIPATVRLGIIHPDKMWEALSGHYHPCMSPNALKAYLRPLLGGVGTISSNIHKLSKIEPKLPIWKREPSITR